MNKKLVILLAVFIPYLVFANGGDQRIVEGKYLINLARSPFTPKAGEPVSMLISFARTQTNLLVSEDLTAKIRIAKLGAGKRIFLFEKNNIKVEGGVLEFPYTFAETGLHEVFIDFVLVSEPKKVYESPDFLLDIQEPIKAEKQATGKIYLAFILGVLASLSVVLLKKWYS